MTLRLGSFRVFGRLVELNQKRNGAELRFLQTISMTLKKNSCLSSRVPSGLCLSMCSSVCFAAGCGRNLRISSPHMRNFGISNH